LSYFASNFHKENHLLLRKHRSTFILLTKLALKAFDIVNRVCSRPLPICTSRCILIRQKLDRCRYRKRFSYFSQNSATVTL